MIGTVVFLLLGTVASLSLPRLLGVSSSAGRARKAPSHPLEILAARLRLTYVCERPGSKGHHRWSHAMGLVDGRRLDVVMLHNHQAKESKLGISVDTALGAGASIYGKMSNYHNCFRREGPEAVNSAGPLVAVSHALSEVVKPIAGTDTEDAPGYFVGNEAEVMARSSYAVRTRLFRALNRFAAIEDGNLVVGYRRKKHVLFHEYYSAYPARLHTLVDPDLGMMKLEDLQGWVEAMVDWAKSLDLDGEGIEDALAKNAIEDLNPVFRHRCFELLEPGEAKIRAAEEMVIHVHPETRLRGGGP